MNLVSFHSNILFIPLTADMFSFVSGCRHSEYVQASMAWWEKEEEGVREGENEEGERKEEKQKFLFFFFFFIIILFIILFIIIIIDDDDGDDSGDDDDDDTALLIIRRLNWKDYTLWIIIWYSTLIIHGSLPLFWHLLRPLHRCTFADMNVSTK